MKNFFKKFLVTICAVSVSATIITASVMATEGVRPMPGSDSTVSSTTDSVDTSSGQQADTSAATNVSPITNTGVNTVTQNTTTNTTSTNKKYQTRFGGFLWFLLSVVVNLILSYMIGNRFYQLARRSAQGSSEIRALRKDIEEKFGNTLRDISEPAIEVMNQNENYSRTDEGITMPERRSHVEINDEEREIMRRWDSKRSKTVDFEDDEYDEDDEYYEDERPVARAPKRAYQPSRRSSGIDFEDDEYGEDEFEDEYEERRLQKSRPSRMMSERERASKPSAKNRARKFLSNVFPSDED